MADGSYSLVDALGGRVSLRLIDNGDGSSSFAIAEAGAAPGAGDSSLLICDARALRAALKLCSNGDGTVSIAIGGA